MLWDNLSFEEQEQRIRKQQSFEKETFNMSINKYWKDYNRAPDEGFPEQHLLDQVVEQLAPHYQEWIDKVCQNTRSPDWLIPLLAIGADKIADLTVRVLMREWLHSGIFKESREAGYLNPAYPLPTAQRIANCIATETISIIGYQSARKTNSEDWRKQSKFIKNWTPKRCIAFSNKVNNLDPKSFTSKQRQDFGHNMIRIAMTSGVVESYVQRYKGGKTWKKKLFLGFPEHILKILDKKHKDLETKFLVYRPMLVPPVPHDLACSGGYLNKELRKELVQRYNSDYEFGVLQEQKYSQPSQLVVDGLNALGNTEWTINKEVLDVMTNMFESNSCLANLPPSDFESFSYSNNFPDKGSPEEKAKWCSEREEVWGEWFKSEAARCRMLVRLSLANKLKEYDFWYMPYTLDFRGRAYSICELLSCQGSDFDRGLIKFARAVPQTERGMYWLKVHVANLFDQDKIPFKDRVKWVDDNMDMLRRVSQDPYTNKEWISDKKKKNPSFQRLASIFELFREDGMTQLNIQMDGKCNGTQHWSAIMKDYQNAELTNVVPSEYPKDLYDFVADKTTDYCKINKKEIPWCDEFLSHWNNGIDRAVTKRSTMCDSYGLTFYGIQKYVKVEGHLSWIPKERIGGAVVELARAIQSGLSSTLTLPNKGKDYLKKVSEIASNMNRHLVYYVPSGFKVVHTYFKPTKRRSLAALFNNKELNFSTYSSNEVDAKAVSQAIPPNFIHSLDASHMFCTIHRMIEHGIEDYAMIHDSFGCHAPNVDAMRTFTKEEFYAMHKQNLLQQFKEDIEYDLGVEIPDIPQGGTLDIECVLESDYFFA